MYEYCVKVVDSFHKASVARFVYFNELEDARAFIRGEEVYNKWGESVSIRLGEYVEYVTMSKEMQPNRFLVEDVYAED